MAENIDQVISDSEGIRDETQAGQNTALRVGTNLKDLGENIKENKEDFDSKLGSYISYDSVEDKIIATKTIQVPAQSLDVGKVMTLTDTAQNMGFKNNADATKGILLGYTITEEGSQNPIYLDAGAIETDREIQILEDTIVTDTEVEFVTPGLNNGLVETYKFKITNQTAPIQFTIYQVGYDKEIIDVELVASSTPDIFLAYLPSLLNIRQNKNYRAVLKSDEPFTIVGTNTLAVFSPFYPYLLGDGYSYSDVEMEIFTESYKTKLDALYEFGFFDYNDSTGNVSITADTWTDVPNDGIGAYTNKIYKPSNVSEIIDTNTGYLDFSDLTLGSELLIRNDFTITPSTNNCLLEARYLLGQGAAEYALVFWSERLDNGSGIPYQRVTNFPIYMGDTNTQGGVGKLQVRLSTNGTLTNAGSYVSVKLK